MIMPKYKGLLQLFSYGYDKRVNLRIICLFLLLPLSAAFAGGGSDSKSQLASKGQTLAAVDENQEERPPDQRTEESQGEKIMKALARAYPDRIEKAEYHDGDWTVILYGERFYYAEGRLLPASLQDKINEYAPLPFYNYLKEFPPWVTPTTEESDRIREQERLREIRQMQIKRSTHFFDTLWRSYNRDDAWEHVKQIRFLGIPVQVHYSILVELSLVEEQILRMAKTNNAVRQWTNNVSSLEGWQWRNIAASQNRSYHAYGAAIDILPKSYGSLEAYWLWTARHTPDWWTVPYSRRFHPPEEVIKAFESCGFIWGGKWRYYDTIHFEYRPEILVLSGIAQLDKRELR